MVTELYPLAKDGIFSTIQGEGVLSGLPMVFIRLAGCSVGCAMCDTDYSVAARAQTDSILRRVIELATTGTEWVWITGGEPTDHDLSPLVRALHSVGLKVGVTTAGTRNVRRGCIYDGVDFLSVSPHHPDKWVQRSGEQLNVVPSLNVFSLLDFSKIMWSCYKNFSNCYVTPCDGKPETFTECLEWVRMYPGWRLGCQAHKYWGMP